MPFRRCDWWVGGAYSAALERFVFLRIEDERLWAEPRLEQASKFDTRTAARAQLNALESGFCALGLERLLLLTLPRISYEL